MLACVCWLVCVFSCVLAYVSFDLEDFKKTEEKVRLDKYIETSALSFCGTRRLEPGPVFNWLIGPEFEVLKRSAEDDDSSEADDSTDKEYVYKLEQRHKMIDRIMAATFLDACVFPDFGAIIALKAENGSQIDNILTVESTNETFPTLRKSKTIGHSIPAAHVLVRFFPSGYTMIEMTLHLARSCLDPK